MKFLEYLQFLYSKKLPSLFCKTQIYGRGTSDGVYRCKSWEKEAQLFCTKQKDDNGWPTLCPYSSPKNLESICDNFHPRAHLKSDNLQHHY